VNVELAGACGCQWAVLDTVQAARWPSQCGGLALAGRDRVGAGYAAGGWNGEVNKVAKTIVYYIMNDISVYIIRHRIIFLK
jgi:hypothetical protein